MKFSLLQPAGLLLILCFIDIWDVQAHTGNHGASNCSCPIGGYWSAWRDSEGCQPASTWLQIGLGSAIGSRLKINFTCGMYGRQVQIRDCLSARRGFPCIGDGVRQIPCGEAAACRIENVPSITCAPGFRLVNETCVLLQLPLPDPKVLIDPFANDPNCQIRPRCPCPEGAEGAWGDWRTVLTSPCPIIANFARLTSLIYEPIMACGSCQAQLQQRECKSLLRGCPCIGPTYRWARCNPLVCLLPLSPCCDDVDGISKTFSLIHNKLLCLPTPLNLWDTKSTFCDRYPADNCTNTTPALEPTITTTERTATTAATTTQSSATTTPWTTTEQATDTPTSLTPPTKPTTTVATTSTKELTETATTTTTLTPPTKPTTSNATTKMTETTDATTTTTSQTPPTKPTTTIAATTTEQTTTTVTTSAMATTTTTKTTTEQTTTTPVMTTTQKPTTTATTTTTTPTSTATTTPTTTTKQATTTPTTTTTQKPTTKPTTTARPTTITQKATTKPTTTTTRKTTTRQATTTPIKTTTRKPTTKPTTTTKKPTTTTKRTTTKPTTKTTPKKTTTRKTTTRKTTKAPHDCDCNGALIGKPPTPMPPQPTGVSGCIPYDFSYGCYSSSNGQTDWMTMIIYDGKGNVAAKKSYCSKDWEKQRYLGSCVTTFSPGASRNLATYKGKRISYLYCENAGFSFDCL